MRALRAIAVMVTVVAMGASAAAQSRGELRITGTVKDVVGKPVDGAVVRAAKKGEVTDPKVFEAKTNEKGEYRLSGMAAGEWIIEAQKEGIGVAQSSATLVDAERTKTIDITIAPPAAAPPAPNPAAVLVEEDKRAVELAKSGKVAEARQIYEDLLVKFPNVHALHMRIADMYAAEGNAAKGLEHITIAVEKEPTNVDFKVLQGELMLEAGQKDAAKELLLSLDLAQVKDPRAYINVAIDDINSGKADNAVALLTRLVERFPNDATILYYRGRANIVAKKLPEATADLEKFVAAAPTAPQAEDAKRLLEQLKKK